MKKIAVISDYTGYTSLIGLIHSPNIHFIHVENIEMAQSHVFDDYVYVYGSIENSIEYQTLINYVKSRIR